MADSRQHSQYDMIRCKLCDHMYEAPRLLDCLHSFCTSCLEKYVSQTVKPSGDTLTCPICNETTHLSAANGVQGLRENTILKKFICQAQKDKTTQLAGQQVLQMSREAISETERKCPEVVANIESIAVTAGHVITGDMLDYIQMTADSTSTVRQSLQANTVQLQLHAMDIVQGIDNVNQMVKDWEETKIQLKNTIRQRSMQIQDTIRAIERGLISKVDDKNLDAEIKNKSFEVKSQLHKILKKSLSLVDFLRLMIDYGDSSELDIFGKVISDHERKLFTSPITITEKTYSFDLPQIEIQEGLDTLFGTLKEITLDTVIIDNRQEINTNDLSAPSNSCMKDIDVIEPSNLLQNYTEVDEKGDHTRNTSLGKRMTSGRILKSGILTKQRGHIDSLSKKSLSFDASIPNSRYQYLLSENQKLHNKTLYGKMEENKNCAELEILDEKNDTKTNTAQTENEDHHELKSSSDVSFEQPENTSCHPPTNTSSVIISPADPSGSIHHHGYRIGTRRLSAPPSLIIDTLNRRRLSALSILERSHINTEGLNLSSDIESGMNEARMEWLQENVRKKAERNAPKDENV